MPRAGAEAEVGGPSEVSSEIMIRMSGFTCRYDSMRST